MLNWPTVQRRDDIAFFSILDERRKNVRWVNPRQLDGAQQLESLNADMEAQAAISQSEKRPTEDCIFIALPTERPPSWLTPELLSALILQAKSSLVLIASRALLQKTLFNFD